MSDENKAMVEEGKVTVEADSAKTDEAHAKVALEYLKLARGEILEKAKVVNQTLGAYLAGSAALASWFYQGVYKPISEGDPSTTAPWKALAAAAFAFMISYLAFAVNWIIYHNERIIAALATYQRDDLGRALDNGPPIWEDSGALRNFDSLGEALKMALVEELIVLAPPVVALTFACWRFGFAYSKVGFTNWWPYSLLAFALLLLALLANVATIRDGFKMAENARKLRDNRQPIPRRVAEQAPQSMPLHPTETQHN